MHYSLRTTLCECKRVNKIGLWFVPVMITSCYIYRPLVFSVCSYPKGCCNIWYMLIASTLPLLRTGFWSLMLICVYFVCLFVCVYLFPHNQWPQAVPRDLWWLLEILLFFSWQKADIILLFILYWCYYFLMLCSYSLIPKYPLTMWIPCLCPYLFLIRVNTMNDAVR